MIGVFDSGVGGLGILKEMLPLFDRSWIRFVADRVNAPYGTRELGEVRELTHHHAANLIDDGAESIVIACNTASAAALHSLRDTFPKTLFIGMEPAVKPAVTATRTGVIGVLATRATFQGRLFSSLVDEFGSDVKVLTMVAPEWVQFVERGEVSGREVEGAVRSRVEPLIAGGADTLVLGCTHFPFLTEAIHSVVGPDVNVIDPAPAVARQARSVHPAEAGLARLDARVTGDVSDFERLCRRLTGIEFGDGILPL